MNASLKMCLQTIRHRTFPERVLRHLLQVEARLRLWVRNCTKHDT